MLENTLIIHTADHGEMGMAHGGMRQKNFNVYEETLRVPLVYSNPKLFTKRGSSQALVSHVDFLPTLASLVGAPASARDAGRASTTPARPRPHGQAAAGLHRVHLRRLPVRAAQAVPTSRRRTTSSASARSAGSSREYYDPDGTNPTSGRCTTSSHDPLER